LSEIDVHRGKDAFKRICDIFLNRLDRTEDQGGGSYAQVWTNLYTEYRDDLGHYFRVLYHIIVFTKRACPASPKFYTNIVRAQLSNSELILLAFNCAYGHGKEKLKSLMEEFEFFDNLDLEGLAGIDAVLRSEFASSAFGGNNPAPAPAAAR
jgi:hypothetical protein